MMTLIFLTICFYAVILLGVLYCSIKGLAMCFEADTVIGVLAAVLCTTIIFASVCFFVYCVQVIWKRNLAEELVAYLNAPKPGGNGL